MYEFSISDPESFSYVADWAELYIATNKCSLSKSEVQSSVELSQGYEPSDTFIDSIWNELERRQYLYGETPPFFIEDRSINFNIEWEDKFEYLMCLILSVFGNSQDSLATGKLFERISNEAIKNYLVNAETIIYGFPQKQKLQDIVTKMCERFQFAPPTKFNDRGVDIIAWKSFKDKRSSQIIILFQCASGNNWRSKTCEISMCAWRNYACWGAYLMKGFCVPKVIKISDFDETSYDAGILLDRPRICKNTFNIQIDAGLKQKMREWCNKKLVQFKDTF